MKQFIKDKPVRWGFKFWVLACPHTGYIHKFEIYTGKRLTKSTNGLGYDVVMNLMDGLFQQGYHLFVDNFYSNPQLFKDLLDKRCLATGTVRDFLPPYQMPWPKTALEFVCKSRVESGVQCVTNGAENLRS